MKIKLPRTAKKQNLKISDRSADLENKSGSAICAWTQKSEFEKMSADSKMKKSVGGKVCLRKCPNFPR